MKTITNLYNPTSFFRLSIFGKLLLFISLIGACGDSNETNEPSQICTMDINLNGEGVSVECLGSDTFFVDSSFKWPAFFASAFMIEGKEYLGISNMNYGNKIHFIEFNNPSNRIDIPIGPLGIGRVRSFDCVDSLLYIFTRGLGVPDSNQLHVVGLSGHYHHPLKYSEYFTFADEIKDESVDGQHIYAFQDSPLQVDGSKVFFTINHSLQTKEGIVAAYLDIATGKLTEAPVHIPSDYLKENSGGNGSYYLSNIFLDPPYCYISFPASGDMYRWKYTEADNVLHTVTTSKSLPELQRPPSAYTGDSEFPYIDISQLEVVQGRYGKLIRIGHSDLFARLIFHSDPNGKIEDYITNRKGSLMIMDSSMTLIGETGVIGGVAQGGVFSRDDGMLYLQDIWSTDSVLLNTGHLVFQKIRISKSSATKTQNETSL